MRITQKDLENIIERLNKVTKNPLTPWTRRDGRNVANVGNYHIGGAYGGVQLLQMATEGGGVKDVFRCGYVPKRELYNLICAYLEGIEAR